MLPAGRTAKSTGTADDDQFKKDLKSIHFKNTVTRSSFDSKPKPWMTFFNNTSADIKTKSSHDPVVVMKFEFCSHSARLLRKLDHVLIWILSTNTGM